MSTDKIFKNIRNRIRRHNAITLLYEFLKLLNRSDVQKIESVIRFPPWYLLLLVKWIVLYGDYERTPYQQEVTRYHVNELVNRMRDLAGVVRRPTQYQNWLLFMRNIAYQQFWSQEQHLTEQRLARQYRLFARLDVNHSFRRAFNDAIGVEIGDFLELSFALLSHFLTQKQMDISADTFVSIEHAYAPNTIENFLNSISIDLEDARQWLRDIESAKNDRERLIDYEIYEQSPFTRYPLIRRGGKYFCVSPVLLEHALQTFVYDLLRERDASSFMDKFGPLFETMVGQSLESISPQLVTETELRECFKDVPGQKVVDFLLVDDDNNIFLDAKGVAMSWSGMVTHLPGTVRSQSKSSALKGIEQAYALAERLSGVSGIHGTLVGKRSNYLLIITFKDLYVQNGRSFRDRIAPDEVDRIIANYGNREWVPLSNIYFISIDDLDILMGCIRQSGRTISEILKHAVESDQTISDMKFSFRQHVFEICSEIDLLPTLRDSLDELIKQLQNRFVG